MCVFDVEGDSLTPTKIYVLSYYKDGEVYSLTDYDDMRVWLLEQPLLIGHNIVGFDIPALERILGIKIGARLIDTLYTSYYLQPKRAKHGLESYGEDFVVPKPKVEDWENLELEVYINRCEEDVKINQKLWEQQRSYLADLYEVDEDEVEDLRILKYLKFKAECGMLQERDRWKLDIDKCQEELEKAQKVSDSIVEELKNVMPPVVKTKVINPPMKPFKKDGTLSVTGARWRKRLKELGLPNEYNQSIKVDDHMEEPNPKSPDQIKSWLYQLGWEPKTFKYIRDKNTNELLRKVPQIKKINSPDLCDSVTALIEQSPQVKLLESFAIINHRIGIFKGFLRDVDDEGFLKARFHGLTNTLRFKHTEIVNLPGVDKLLGEELRGCLVAREGMVLCGSDVSSLENQTKCHYIHPYDPDYVEEMQQPDFDPHLDMAVQFGTISVQDMKDHVAGVKDLGGVRKRWKPVNYSGVYGIMPPSLSRDLNCSIAEAEELLDMYWKRNWAVKQLALDTKTKAVNGDMWLYNPVSHFWYSLRHKKDIFSTLNQGTGVYVFDCWIKRVLKKRFKMNAQFHDEGVWEVKKGYEHKMEKLLRKCMEEVNKELKLNVTIGIEVAFGDNYSQVH